MAETLQSQLTVHHCNALKEHFHDIGIYRATDKSHWVMHTSMNQQTQYETVVGGVSMVVKIAYCPFCGEKL